MDMDGRDGYRNMDRNRRTGQDRGSNRGLLTLMTYFSSIQHTIQAYNVLFKHIADFSSI